MENFCECIDFAATLLGPHINSVMGSGSAHTLPVSKWCPLAQSRAACPPACAEVPGIDMLEEAQAAAWCFVSSCSTSALHPVF